MSVFEVRTFTSAGVQVGVLPGVFAEFTDEFGTEGYVKLSVPKGSVAAGMLAQRTEVALFIEGTEVPNSRALVMEREGDESSGGDAPGEAFMETWGGRTLFSRFRRAIVYPERWPAYYTPDSHSFNAVTPGNILKTLIDRAKARGAIPQIATSTWNALTDSMGSPWANTVTIEYRAGTTLLAVIENLIRQGAIEVRMFGRELYVYNALAFGVNRAATVILRRGLQATDTPYSESTDEVVNSLLILGDEGVMLERQDAASIGIYGREEGALSQGGTKDIGTLTALGDNSLSRSSGLRGQYTVKVEMFGTPGTVPFVDFFVGDWISLARTEQNGLPVKYRVRQMSAMLENDRWVVNLTLNDKFAELDLLTAKKVEGILGGASADTIQPVTGSGDTSTPKAPTGLIGNAEAFIDSLGNPQGRLTLSWNAPTENTDETALTDLYFYRAYMRDDNPSVTEAPWRSIGETSGVETYFHYSPLPVNTWKRFAVAAVDETGRVSPLTPEIRVFVQPDAGPPPKPSQPEIDVYLGSFIVNWDGLADGGGAMPGDWAGTNIHISTDAGFDPSTTPVAAVLTARDRYSAQVISGLAYGTAHYVKLVAFDSSNPPNFSEPSDAASAIPKRVVGDDDIEPGTISTGQVDFDAFDLGAQATFYGPSAPTANNLGDFWVNTSDNNSLFRWDGDSWEKVDNALITQAYADAAAALAAANDALTVAQESIEVYFQNSAPTGMVAENVGDLWIDTDDGNKLYVYNGSWTLAQDQSIATALAAAEAAAAAQAFNLNPTFKNWTGTYPDGYSGAFGSSPAPTKETSLVRTAPNAVRWNVTNTTVDWAMQEGADLDPLPLNLAYVTIQVDFMLTSGTLAGAGYLMYWAGMTNNLAVLNLANEVGTVVANKWYRVTKVLARPSNATGTHTGYFCQLAASYNGGGLTRATKNIIFDRVAFWPSTAEEIQAYNSASAASVTTLTGTVNTKNTIFSQTSQPATTGRTIGDIWYDTDDGNQMYVWTGGAWTVSDLGVQAVSFTARQLGSMTTYYQTTQPASGMVAGDLWLDTDDSNKVYRYSGSAWQIADDQRIGQAITAAAGAQATADGKVRTFAQTTAPGSMTATDAGDLWIDTDDTNKLYRWSGSAWVLFDDTRIAGQAAQIATLQTNLATTQSSLATARAIADGLVDTFYQTSAPSGGSVSEGDVWVDTDDPVKKSYRRSAAGTWVEITDTRLATALAESAAASAAADGKITSFYQATPPTGMTDSNAGDIWFDTDDGNKAYWYRSSTPGPAGWVAVPFGSSAIAPNAISMTNLVSEVRASMGQVFFDDFSDVSRWARMWGASSFSAVPRADARSGSSVFQTVRTDDSTFRHSTVMPFDPSVLYRLTVRVRENPAAFDAAVFHAGFLGYANDGVTLVDNIGTSWWGPSNHYPGAAYNANPNANWGEYVGYIKGVHGPSTNTISGDTSTFEGGTVGSWIVNNGNATLANSTTRGDSSARSMLITWGANSVNNCSIRIVHTGLTVGLTYRAEARVWVPSTHPTVRMITLTNGTSGLGQYGTPSNTTGAWQTIFIDFVAASTDHVIGINNNNTTTAGQQVWVDNIKCYRWTSSAQGSDPKLPMTVHENVRFFLPAMWQTGGDAGTTHEVDMFKIEAVPTGLVERANIALAAINAALIEDLAVIEAKIGNLAVTNAKINDVAANKITTAELAVGVRIILGPETSTHAEVKATGISAFIPDGEGGVREIVSVGSGSGDVISVSSPSGEQVATIDDLGQGMFRTVDSLSDMTVQGFPLLGETGTFEPDVGSGALVSGHLDKLGRGAVQFGRFGPSTDFGSAGWVYELAFNAYPGRSYMITFGGALVKMGLANTPRGFYIGYATPSSIGGDAAGQPKIPTQYSYNTAPVVDQLVTLPSISTVLRCNQGGTGIGGELNAGVNRAVLGANGNFSLHTGGYVSFSVIDLGPDNPSNMISAVSNNATVNAKQTFTTRWYPSHSETYTAGGAARGDTLDLLQGYTSSYPSYGDMFSQMVFNSTAFWSNSSGEVGKSIGTALSGGTLLSAVWYGFAKHWHYYSGGTARIRVGNANSLSSTAPTSAYKDVTGWGVNKGVRVGLPLTALGFTASTRSVYLGRSGGTNMTFYGRFGHPSETDTKMRPYLELSYQR